MTSDAILDVLRGISTVRCQYERLLLMCDALQWDLDVGGPDSGGFLLA